MLSPRLPNIATSSAVRVLGGAQLLLLLLVLRANEATSQSYQSNKYPAGLHPSLCPHYPYCDNAALGGFARQVAAIRHGGSQVPGYPASLSPHACPNYPYCSHHVPPEAIHYRRADAPAPAPPHYAFRRSVHHPATCPNYPYCH